MKKLLLLIMAILVLNFTACSNQDFVQESPDVTSPQEKVDTAPPKSECDGGVYTNSYIGISLSLPEGWSFLTEKMYDYINQESGVVYDKETRFDMMAINEDSNDFIIAEYIKYSLSQDSYINSYQAELREIENFGYADYKFGYITTVTIADIEFSTFSTEHVSGESPDTTGYLSVYVFKIADYVLRICVESSENDFSWFEESIVKSIGIA